MRFREFSNDTSTTNNASFVVTPTTNLRSVQVADGQKALVALGFPLPRFGVDGILGPETAGSIRAFQAKNSIPQTGLFDKATADKLNAELQKVPQVLATLTPSTAADVKPASAKDIDVSTIQDPDFSAKLEKVATALGVAKEDLITIMRFESKLNPQAVNPYTGASGLIQFMPKTAEGLGTSVDDIRKMSAVDQLDYVYKYFKMLGVKPGMDLGDLYMAVFMPAKVGADDSTIVGREGQKVYDQNRVLDSNKDGILTVGDIKSAITRTA